MGRTGPGGSVAGVAAERLKAFGGPSEDAGGRPSSGRPGCGVRSADVPGELQYLLQPEAAEHFITAARCQAQVGSWIGHWDRWKTVTWQHTRWNLNRPRLFQTHSPPEPPPCHLGHVGRSDCDRYPVTSKTRTLSQSVLP